MIELIFVIVILGILAAVAIPKLAATRDDAKVASELTNLSTCINDVGNAYTATGTENNDTASCNALKCASVATGTETDMMDGNVTITLISTDYCAAVEEAAKAKDLNGTYEFGGTHIKFD